MVLTMSRMQGRTLDPKRVVAITGVVLIHLAVLAVMLLPRQPVELWTPPPPEIEVTITPVELPPPPRPPEPIVVPPPPTRFVPVTPPAAPTPAPTPSAPVVSNTIVVDTPGDPVIPGAIVDPEASGPLPGTQGNLVTLKTLRAPPPAYPRRELARGVEGEVELRVLVNADGVPTRFEVIGGTRNRNFELAAIRAVKRWRFQPHEVNGVAQPAWALVPFNFRVE